MSDKVKEYIFTTIVLALFLILIFFVTDQYMAMQLPKGKFFWSPSLKWDHEIPVYPVWIWIYLLYFPLCFLPITWKETWANKIFFRKTITGFAFTSLMANFTFWIFPSRILRPAFESDGINGRLMMLVYKLDPGFNIFPSLHVALAAYIACLAWSVKKKLLSTGVWILCFLIALSTLFVKQHYIPDLPSGLVFGIVGYFVVFKLKVSKPTTGL
jgi:membrane-associated phospholipid phosphatase